MILANPSTLEATATDQANYVNLDYSRAELMEAMREGYDTLIEFVTTSEFQAALAELRALPAPARPSFVVDVLLNKGQLEQRGINVPDDIMIQRSAFGDRRPTLFAVKRWLPARFKNVWENVNLTFDNIYLDEVVSRDAQVAWRRPMSIADQAQLMADGRSLEDAIE